MSRVRLLPAAERSVQPWKNGGGETSEVAVFPPGADLDGFDWRLSTARVAAPGPFSHFEGADRILAVVEGRLKLVFDGGQAGVQLGRDSLPLSFPGDMEVHGEAVSGAVMDLNLMVRRGRFKGSIERVTPGGSLPLALSSPWTIVLFAGTGRLRCWQETLSIQPLDAVLLEGAEADAASLQSEGDVYIVRLSPAG